MKEFEKIPYIEMHGMRMFFNTFMYRCPHYHKSLELILIIKGEMTVSMEEVSLRLLEDDVAVINSGVPHELTAVGSNCTFLCLQFMPDAYWSGYPSVKFLSNTPREYMSTKEFSDLSRTLLKMAELYFLRRPYFEAYCISAVHKIIYLLLTHLPTAELSTEKTESQKAISARIIRLVEFVDKNYKSKIKLSDFAEQEGKSPSYISHFVSNTLNQSFQSYVNTVRFYAACRLMAAGNMSMLDICYEVGFSDYRYFSNVFKEKTGQTPSQYQKLHGDTKLVNYDSNNEHIYTDQESSEMIESLRSKFDNDKKE